MSSRRTLVLFGIVATLAMVPASVRAAPILTIALGPSVGVGGVVEASVNVADVADLYAFQFDFTFDPSVVGAVDVTEGSFLSTAGSTLFEPGTIDNPLGTITFIAGTLVGAPPGASGSGTLATIRLMGLAPGTSGLTLSNVILLDSALADIRAEIGGGSVSIVPEPATLVLVSFGLAALGRRKMRARRDL